MVQLLELVEHTVAMAAETAVQVGAVQEVAAALADTVVQAALDQIATHLPEVRLLEVAVVAVAELPVLEFMLVRTQEVAAAELVF